MKFVLVFVAALALAASAPTRSLSSDIQDIIDALPIIEGRLIARRYINADAEVQAALKYLQGDEWAGLVAEVEAKEGYQSFVQFLTAAGVDVENGLAWIREHIQSLQPEPTDEVLTGGVRAMLDEINANLDIEAVLAVVNDKLENSSDFQEFFAVVSSEEARKLVNEVSEIAEVQRLGQVLRDMGIDVDAVIEVVKGILGWN